MFKFSICVAFASLFTICVAGQKRVETIRETVMINNDGSIEYMLLNGSSDTISFRQDRWKGPSFDKVTLKPDIKDKTGLSFVGTDSLGLSYRLVYSVKKGYLTMTTTVKNTSKVVVQPEKVRLRLGIDTYMVKYPDWNHIYFPTTLRAEKTHMWGYLMTPTQKVVVIASPDPIASWVYDYQQHPYQIQGKRAYSGEHRIHTISLDLLHTLPLPERYPQHLFALQPGQSHTANIYIGSVESIRDVQPTVAKLTNAPLLDAQYYTISEGGAFEGTMHGIQGVARMEIITPRNEVFTIEPDTVNGKWSFTPRSGRGLYKVMVYSNDARITEAMLYVRPDMVYYLNTARKEALRSQPTATHHAESFYPMYTYFLAKRYIPDAELDRKAEHIYDSLFKILYDPSVGEMRDGKYRIQDAATMAGVLADRYRATGEISALENAASLVEFLIRCQRENGAFYNFTHNVHYTSVIYLAKSIMEVMSEEKKLAANDPVWKQRYERHLESVRRAMDNLALLGDNIQTEGQMTFEDGMISCSISQLAMAALRETDLQRKELYTKMALELAGKHECLTMLLMPDCRMNGATLRFWEYQYTINLLTNALNSPCGWSAWKTYGTWYLYLLTGEYEYLRQTFNSLGSCLQLVDINTGELRFGFLPDPYIDAAQYVEMPKGSGKPVVERVRLAEQYVSQTSEWHKYPNATWREKWGIDNFVHEVFKCMSEIALTNAYIIEMEDGTLQTINCVVLQESGDRLSVSTNEPLVRNLHVNLRKSRTITTRFQGVLATHHNVSGMRWLGETPEELMTF